MAASKTMAEIVASSKIAPSTPASASTNNNSNNNYSSKQNKIPNPNGHGEHTKNGGSATAVENYHTKSNKKEESGSSTTIVRAFPHLTITVYIPTVCVGVLIGKRGYTIDKIQRHAVTESSRFYSSEGLQQSQPQGGRRDNGGSNKQSSKQKKVSPDSVRISVVNYPPPAPTAQQHQQNYENYDNPHYLVNSEEYPVSAGPQKPQPLQQQKQQQHHPSALPHPGLSQSALHSSIGDMGVPPTYTELDFSNPQWTPIVIRADPIAALHASRAIHEICFPEYVGDRTHLVYIMDVPVPAVVETASNNSNTISSPNTNLRHASIVGKKGNKLLQLSADHSCRIMVPPKQLGHNIIQLEAPLQECCSCLRAISARLQPDNASDFSSGDEQECKEPLSPQNGDANHHKPHPSVALQANTNSSNNNYNGQGQNQSGQTKNARNRNKIENARSNYQISLIVQPLPSQTKLRNIARKTETKILRKKIPKSQQKQKQKQLEEQRQKQEQQPPEDSELLLEDVDGDDDAQEQQEDNHPATTGDGSANNSSRDTANNPKSSGGSWRLTVVATTEKKATKALDMLKVLVSKGYEVLVEDMGTTTNQNDATQNNKGNKSPTEQPYTCTNRDAEVPSEVSANGTESQEAPFESAVDDSKGGSNNHYNNKSGGGRGSRGKKKKKYLYK
ncbi:unnamed protein product [Pseudo-nitzschia multistriata]|uniref:K Homology domain-containing protein n=1 Tax=Pseudo-nitzschia multistriata TaxID=183589 RepID=A0A448Z5R1_9STRA|nr:unnamed protein product [Pseudo-nitzschia multistriata]